jgi:COP9 signalosome complex subunit 5
LEQAEAALGRSNFMMMDPNEKRTEDSCKTTIEVIHGLMAQVIKDRLFNYGSNPCGTKNMLEDKAA